MSRPPPARDAMWAAAEAFLTGIGAANLTVDERRVARVQRRLGLAASRAAAPETMTSRKPAAAVRRPRARR